MDRPNLISNPTAALLADQIEAWAKIVSLSNLIEENASQRDWDQVLAMADAREMQVSAFFKGGVCSAIFPVVVEDLEILKQQHTAILEEIEQDQTRIQDEENSLLKIKAQISQMNFPPA